MSHRYMKISLQDILPLLYNEKKLVGLMVVFVLLILGVFTMAGQFTLAYQEKEETEQKIASMQSSVAQWQNKIEELDKVSARPVEPDEVDKIQTEILLMAKSNHLNTSAMKERSGTKEKDGRLFDITLQGRYEDTISFFNKLQNKNVLIGIRNFSIMKHAGEIQTKFSYKIYTD